MNSLVHIAPQLPPAIDGVGDYCSNLWQHWPEADRDWTFLVTRGAAQTAAAWPQIEVREFERSDVSLAAKLEETGCNTVLLHYVGYGYQPKGIPVWLPNALEQWKRGDAQRHVVIMFHEMYARSSPLRSPFWVAPIARRIIRKLVALSDAWVTSCNRYFFQLTTQFAAPPANGRIIPIGSNIPLVATAGSQHFSDAGIAIKFRFVLFGLAKTRLWALEKHGRLLRALGGAGMIEHVTLLGKRPEPDDERVWQRFADAAGETIPWRKRFDVSSAEVSNELAEHDFGLLANEPDILTKSGVFAALATHGVVPIVAGRPHRTLPRPFQNAALINDETSKTIPNVLSALRNNISLKELRERLLTLAASELAWSRITETWRNVIENCGERRILISPGAVWSETHPAKAELISTARL